MDLGEEWTFHYHEQEDEWRIAPHPEIPPSAIEAIEWLTEELSRLGRAVEWVDDWVVGSATEPDYRSGTEGVGVRLIDSAVVRLSADYGHFPDSELSRSQFRAALRNYLEAWQARDDGLDSVPVQAVTAGCGADEGGEGGDEAARIGPSAGGGDTQDVVSLGEQDKGVENP